tara:strand:- start:2108 stop:3049 length:942 start_codon:yes stop_codon:yes gene_type:complete
MLGLGIGKYKGGGVSASPFSPEVYNTDDSKMVGWWDFSSNEYLRTTISTGGPGSTKPSSDGDEIRYVSNRCTTTNKLGTYLFQETGSNNYVPRFKTGGQAGYTYAHFGDTGFTNAYLYGKYSTNSNYGYSGGISSGVFSNMDLNTGNLTTFIVANANEVNATTSEHMINLVGRTSGGGMMLLTWAKLNTTDKLKNTFILPSVSNQSHSGDTVLGTDVYLITQTYAPTAANPDFVSRYNGVQDATGNASAVEEITDAFTRTNSGVAIGTQFTGSAAQTNFSWHGTIYEIIVFDDVLDSDKIDNMNTYFTSKYSL